MIFLTFNDAHFSDQPPESRTDQDYTATLLTKLDQIAKVAVKLQATAVLNAGDLFHIKTASRNSHSLVQRLTKKFREMPLVVSIAGNHDISMDRLESLGKQPLGDLIESGVTQYVHLSSSTFPGPIRGVKVCGLSFVPKLEDWAPHESFKRGDCAACIGIFHCAAEPAGGVFHDERVYSYQELMDLFPEVDVFVLGHLHHYTGIHKIKNVWFINIGALSRCSLHRDNLERRVYAGLIEVTPENSTIMCRQIALKVLPADQVLSTEKFQRMKEERQKIEAFVDQLKAETETAPQGQDVITGYLSRADVPKEVRAKALQLLETAGLNG